MDNEEPKPNTNMGGGNPNGGAARRDEPPVKKKQPSNIDPTMQEVLKKINEAESVLVALSNDPSVDELTAAMGLSMVLDNIGKRATAIYSGKTPNVLKFLKPEECFETGTESLQDFVIALNKDKADHLRYKIDGDYVKVYVTPYKTTISDEDLEFSRGDYNVDLVISLNVPAATELDAALKEHGRIMHDASSVNITTGVAGKFGDIEWVDTMASSLSEMVAKLAFELEPNLDAVTATVLLTGLVAATDRFSSPTTTPDAMMLSAKLMSAGADQQLVAQNVEGQTAVNDNNTVESNEPAEGESDEPKDETDLRVSHDEDENKEAVSGEEPAQEEIKDENAEKAEETSAENAPKEESAANPIVAPEPEQAQTEPEQPASSIGVDSVQAAMAEALNTAAGASDATQANDGTVAGVNVSVVPDNADGYAGEKVVNEILGNVQKESTNVGSVDYGKLIDEALNEPLPGQGGIQVGAQTPEGPKVDTQDVNRVDATQGSPIAAMANAAEVASGQTTTDNGSFPPIVQTGGSLGYVSPSEMGNDGDGLMGIQRNPAVANTPIMNGLSEEMGAGMPDMNFGNGSADPNSAMMPEMGQISAPTPAPAPETTPVGGTMPMPGQDMTPPPVLPQPDFGEMPPVATPPMPEMNMPQPENPAPVAMTNPAATSEATVQPDLNVPSVDSMGLPQMPAVQDAGMGAGNMIGNPGQPATPIVNNPSDPSAFKIPGIHM